VYRGRFAPSPTGHLHFGSLVAAAASYLDARSVGGAWLVRMEDVDPGRCRQEYADSILQCLEEYGFEWDGEVVYQSTRGEAYEEAIGRLAAVTFPCGCTRREAGEVYPGTCRGGVKEGRVGNTLRLRVLAEERVIADRWMGEQRGRVDAVGDFTLRKADGSYAYQLAVVVDDEWQGITDVVRGADLLESTFRQIYLQELLGLRRVRYSHLPLVMGEDGLKLSKQNHAEPLTAENAGLWLGKALRFLGLEMAAEGGDVAVLWKEAIGRWAARR
jgi:glutamyl-Q tRNA(Asp) synthetase